MFAFDLFTAATHLCYYLQGAIATESTAWNPAQSASPCTKNTRLPESQRQQGRRGLYSEAACSELPHTRLFQHFSLGSGKTWRACPCCLHSWSHGKDCLIWNLTWAIRLHGDVREGIQVGEREVTVKGSNTGQRLLEAKCAIDLGIMSKLQEKAKGTGLN